MKSKEYLLKLKTKDINFIFEIIDIVVSEFEGVYSITKYRKFKNRLKQTIEKIDKDKIE